MFKLTNQWLPMVDHLGLFSTNWVNPCNVTSLRDVGSYDEQYPERLMLSGFGPCVCFRCSYV